MATAALLLVSVAISAYSAVQQGKAQEQASKHNAKIANENAGIAKKQAAREAQQIRKQNYVRLGKIKAEAGASGGDSNSGSAMDFLATTASEGELEAKNALYQGGLESRRFKNDASLELFKGKNAKKAGYLSAASSVAGGASSAYGSYNSGLVRQ